MTTRYVLSNHHIVHLLSLGQHAWQFLVLANGEEPDQIGVADPAFVLQRALVYEISVICRF